MKKASLLFVTLFISALSFGQHDHSHEKDTSYHIREHWGDFAEGEIIKFKEISWRGTPIEKHITKKGKLTEEYAYVDSIDLFNIVYESDGLMVSGMIVKPKIPGDYPCVIFNRGGNRDYGQLIVGTAVQYLGLIASKGYIVIASNYRGNGGSEGQEEFGGSDINDVLNLIPALSQIEGADTSRIGMMGVSRGGMMSYKALYKDGYQKTTSIDAVAVIGGMSDFITTIRFRPDMETHVFAELIPEYSRNGDSICLDRSANMWANEFPKSCQILILHGSNDDKVSVDEARELHDVLDQSNHPHCYMEFIGDNHGLMKHQKESFKAIIQWFDTYVRDEGTAVPVDSKILVE